MPGLSFIIKNRPQFASFQINNLTDNLCLEDHEKCTVIKNLTHAYVAYTNHRNYPLQVSEFESCFFIIEGLIYNYKEKVLLEKLKKIAESYFSGSFYYKDLISEFVNNADGDFIIAISDTHCENMIFFNDFIGRIPLYFSESDGMTIISRDIKTILEHAVHIEFKKSSVVDFISLGYFLGNKTFFEGVYKLYPSQVIEIRKVNKYSLKTSSSNEFNFVLKEPFRSKKLSILELKNTFLESIKNRVTYLQEAGYSLICDLSGGYDSRTILGGLSSVTNDVTYYNFQYIRDESPWAKGIFEKLGSPGIFEKLSFNNAIDYISLNRLIYKTDGLVNFYSTAICYSDLKYLFDKNPNITARFGGLAGEFIRHPLKNFYKSIYWGIENGLYSFVIPEFACKMIKLNYQDYKEETIEYLASYKEKTESDKLKHFYYEYYQNMVGGGAEDRERLHFWSVHPLWSKDIMRIVFNRIPLDWTGFLFHTEFMKQINRDLLNVPIYNSHINLKSYFSKSMYDINYKKQAYKRKAFLILKEKVRVFYDIYINHLKIKKYRIGYTPDLDIENLFNRNIEPASSFFEKQLLEKNWYQYGGQYNQLLTFMIYYNELMTRYSNKF
jgi:Glutamine amidotransferase domain